MIKITVEGPTLEEAIAAMETTLAALQGNADAPAPKAAPKAAAKPAAAKAKPAPEPEGLDYETEVRPHVVALSKEGSREIALEVLGKFTNPVDDEPCTKGTEVAEADWGKLLKAIKKARTANELDISDELNEAIEKAS